MADEGVKESKDLLSEQSTLEALQLNAKRPTSRIGSN